MAQFGKHFFGSSYFGKTSTFVGVYETTVMDAGEPFSGNVTLSIKADLRKATYLANSLDWAYPVPASWTVSGAYKKTLLVGSEAKILACGRSFSFAFKQAVGEGKATISFTNTATSTTTTHTVDAAISGSFSVEKPYADYLITIKTTQAPFSIEKVEVGVTEIAAEIAAATVENNGVYDWGSHVSVPLSWDAPSGSYQGQSPALTNKRYVKTKLHLATSDGDVSPFVDRLDIYSGDIHKRASNGQWLAAINFSSAASDAGKSFARAKRIEWKENETEESSIVIRSTSTTNSFPNKSQLESGSYWKSETAPYRVKRGVVLDYGTPYSRISLGENGNGGFAQTRTLGSLFKKVAFEPTAAGLANTSIREWLEWNDLIGFPVDSAETAIRYAFYASPDDVVAGYAPLFSIDNRAAMQTKAILLEKEFGNKPLYLRIELERTVSKQSPVVDFVEAKARLLYESSSNIGRYKDTLCALDNHTGVLPGKPLGSKKLKDVPVGFFNWPNLTQSDARNAAAISAANRDIFCLHTAKYPGQIQLGFGETFGNKASLPTSSQEILTIYALTEAENPQVSTQTVTDNKLFWHYSYDGGSASYYSPSERELSANFTPDLLTPKKYRYLVYNGWSQESILLPQAMTWDEAADLLGVALSDLQTENPNVKLYGGKIPAQVELYLPNTSVNPLISLRFKQGGTDLTELSSHNGQTNNKIEATVIEGTEHIREWVSDEVIYEGVLNEQDLPKAYIHTELGSYSKREQTSYIIKDGDTYESLAKTYNLKESSLRNANGNKALVVNDWLIIPESLSLPQIPANIVYTEDNPYVVELISGSVRRAKDNRVLPDESISFGSSEEDGLSYTVKESTPVSVTLTRGPIPNGQDALPYGNVQRIISVYRVSDGVSYAPYQNTGSPIGDYLLKDNTIDWSASHAQAKEPSAENEYVVVLTYGVVDSLRVLYTSDYSEKRATDRLWRSSEVKVFEGIVSPGKPFEMTLPEMDTFTGFGQNISNAAYVVEDDDLWVKTTIEETDSGSILKASLQRKDPKRNWHPSIEPGFYYLNNQEHYLYSEAVETIHDSKALPILTDIVFEEKGFTLNGL